MAGQVHHKQSKTVSYSGLLKSIGEAVCYVANSWLGFPRTRENCELLMERGLEWKCVG